MIEQERERERGYNDNFIFDHRYRQKIAKNLWFGQNSSSNVISFPGKTCDHSDLRRVDKRVVSSRSDNHVPPAPSPLL